MTFSLDDYVDVPERIKLFAEKYPDGSLQSEVTFVDGGVLCKAFAYRTPVDTKPGIGHAFEPVPGKTPYTKDSEVMNAETSAWGRAIVALGFETKKIASRQEVEARQSASPQKAEGDGSPFKPPAAAVGDPLGLQSARADAPADGGEPASVICTFGKHKGSRYGDIPRKYLEWWVAQDEPKTAQLRREREAVRILLGQSSLPVSASAGAPDLSDDDIPF